MTWWNLFKQQVHQDILLSCNKWAKMCTFFTNYVLYWVRYGCPFKSTDLGRTPVNVDNRGYGVVIMYFTYEHWRTPLTNFPVPLWTFRQMSPPLLWVSDQEPGCRFGNWDFTVLPRFGRHPVHPMFLISSFVRSISTLLPCLWFAATSKGVSLNGLIAWLIRQIIHLELIHLIYIPLVHRSIQIWWHGDIKWHLLLRLLHRNICLSSILSRGCFWPTEVYNTQLILVDRFICIACH